MRTRKKTTKKQNLPLYYNMMTEKSRREKDPFAHKLPGP